MRHLARLITTLTLALSLAAVPTALLTTPAQAKTWAPTFNAHTDPAADLDEFEDRLLLRINRVRTKHGLNRVEVFESCLDGKAEGWARRIKRTDKFKHRDQMGVIQDCDLTWTGETLVRGSGLTPKVAVRAWLNSPSHRAILLKPRARRAGIGARVDAEGRVVAVLNFGDRN